MIPKFRAWMKSLKWMCEVTVIDYDLRSLDICRIGDVERYTEMSVDKDEVVLMQSTGLKDKNGVEIFEGDVVARNDRFPSVVKFGRWVYEEDFGAKVRNVGFYIDSSYTDEEWLQSIDYEDISKNYEVIGNIYENLELLEADNDPE